MITSYAVFRLRFNGEWSPVEGAGYFESSVTLTTRKAIYEFIATIAGSVHINSEDVLLLNWVKLDS